MFIEMDCPCKGKYLDKMLQPGILDDLRQNFRKGDANLISAIEKKMPTYEKTLADTISGFIETAE